MAGIKMIEDPATRYAVMLGALSQSTRLRIIEVVAKGGAEGTPAGQIARAVHCPASTLSFHLKELSQSGLLRAAPQGRFIRYSVSPGAFESLAGFINSLPGLPDASKGTAGGKDRGGPRTKRKGARKGKLKQAVEREGQLSIFGD
jgi:ArsR family transcriptional regulator